MKITHSVTEDNRNSHKIGDKAVETNFDDLHLSLTFAENRVTH